MPSKKTTGTTRIGSFSRAYRTPASGGAEAAEDEEEERAAPVGPASRNRREEQHPSPKAANVRPTRPRLAPRSVIHRLQITS